MATNPSDPVARMYALALHEVAVKRGILGKVHAGLEAIGECWQDKGFRDFFTSPRVPSEVKVRGMREALTGRVPEEVLNFILLLIRKAREPIFDNILDAFGIYRDEAENRAHAFVQSGTEMNEAEKESLIAEFTKASGGKKIVMHYSYRPELLGGAKVRLGDLMVDTTLRTKLARLARHIAT